MAKKEKEIMDESKLSTIIDGLLAESIGVEQGGSNVVSEREKALKYYLNEPLGDEELGRSSLQDSTVHDTIEAFLPALLAPFISTDSLCDFKPSERGDGELAKISTKYINHILMVDNHGVSWLYTFAKDGLLQKNAFICVDWQQKEHTEISELSTDALGLQELQSDSSVEILEVAVVSGGAALDIKEIGDGSSLDVVNTSFEVKIRRKIKNGRGVVINIPPEFVIVHRNAKTIEDSSIIGWQELVSISQLREEGYPEDKIEAIPRNDGGEYGSNSESYTRMVNQGGTYSTNVDAGDSSRMVWRTVTWQRVDYDGDGYAELRKVIRAGNNKSGGVVLYNEEADFVPMVTFTPCPMPHVLIGRSLADQTMDIQYAKTWLLRGIMNGVGEAIEPRFKVLQHANGIDDTWDALMLRSSMIPVDDMGVVERLNDAPNTANAYQMLEQFERMTERRSPVTRQMLAIDPDALNKTATEASIQQNASSQRQELVLRLFAEAVGQICKMMLKLAVKNQDKPRMLRLNPNAEAVSIDPRYWDVEMDVSVKVGLGTGTKEQQLTNIMMINQMQMTDLQMGLPTVDPSKIYNTRAHLVEYAGLTAPEMYFIDPSANQEEQQQSAPPPDQAHQQAEAAQIEQEIQKAYDAGKKAAEDEIKMLEIQSTERMHALDIKIKEAELQMRGQENQYQAAGFNV